MQELSHEGMVEGLVRTVHNKVESQLKAERRLKMWEKVVVNRLGELSSVTAKISTAGN